MKKVKLERAKTAKPKIDTGKLSKTGPAKIGPVKIDQAKLKAAIAKIQDRKQPELELLQMVRQSKQAKLRRKLGKQLRTRFEGAAFDAR